MKQKTIKVLSILLICTVVFMTFSVNAFADCYEDDYVKVEYPENYDVTKYSYSEDTFGFYVDLYFSQWEIIDGKEYYTGNTVELFIEHTDSESPDGIYDESYWDSVKYIASSEENIQSMETYHETIDGYDVLFFDMYYYERYAGDNGERITEDRLYSDAFIVHNNCMIQVQMYISDAEDFKSYRNETLSQFLSLITYDVDDIQEYGEEELAVVILVLAFIVGVPLLVVVVAVIVIIVLSKKKKKKQMQQPVVMPYYYPPQPIAPTYQQVVPPQPVVPDSKPVEETTAVNEENNSENR